MSGTPVIDDCLMRPDDARTTSGCWSTQLQGGDMLGRQKQVLQAFQRVRAWLEQNPSAHAKPPLAGMCRELDEVVSRAERAAVHQGSGHRLKHAATRELRAAVRTLRDRHLKPIAAMARAARDSNPGLDIACRTPRRKMPVTLLAADARAVRVAIEPLAEWFVNHGRQPEFLAELESAVVEMERVQMRRSRAESLHVGATSALVHHLKRARQLVEFLDCHVQSAFAGDAVKLAEWGVARRVQGKPGVRREVLSAVLTVAVEEQPARTALTLSVAA
jgi:hypothetical protein